MKKPISLFEFSLKWGRVKERKEKLKSMMYNSIKSVAEEIKKGNIFPWIYQDSDKVKGIIISPDTDGFVSALFLNEIFKWKVTGFYDGKLLVTLADSDFEHKKESYVFVDMEILRSHIKSIGHHILLYNAQNPHSLITSIENTCIQPNNWRGMDVKNTFLTKYPFGTFHLLISILYYLYPKRPVFNFNPKKAIVPSIYIDGVFKNLLNYPENCLDWLKYMTSDNLKHPFELLLNHPTTPKQLMNFMRSFFNTLNNIWTTQNKRGKGKIKLNKDISNNRFKDKVSQELIKYLDYLAQQYDYTFRLPLWPVIKERLAIFRLTKKILPATKSQYDKVINKKPVSFAVTSKARNGLEYTLDVNKIFS